STSSLSPSSRFWISWTRVWYPPAPTIGADDRLRSGSETAILRVASLIRIGCYRAVLAGSDQAGSADSKRTTAKVTPRPCPAGSRSGSVSASRLLVHRRDRRDEAFRSYRAAPCRRALRDPSPAY